MALRVVKNNNTGHFGVQRVGFMRPSTGIYGRKLRGTPGLTNAVKVRRGRS